MNGTRKVIGVVALLALFGVATGLAKGKGTAHRRPAAENADLTSWMENKVVLPVLAIHGYDDPAKNAAEINAVAAQIASDAKGSSYPIARVVEGIAELIPELEGLIWRMRDIVEPSDWLHATILYRLRVTYYNDFAYGPHIKALLDFITTPSTAKGKKFECVGEMQDWLVAHVASGIEKLLANWPQKFQQDSNYEYEFKFDRRLMVGQRADKRLIDIDEKDKLFIKPYMYTLKFMLERVLMGIYYGASIDLEGLPKLVNEVALQTGINEAKGKLRFDDPVKGMTPELLYKTIRETPGLESLLTYRPDSEMGIGPGQCPITLRRRESLGDKVEAERAKVRDSLAQGVNRLRGRTTQAGQYTKASDYLKKAFDYGLVSADDQLRAYNCGISFAVHGGDIKVNDGTCERLEETFVKDPILVAKGDQYLFDPNSMMENLKSKYNELEGRAKAFRLNAKNQSAPIMSPVTGNTRNYNVKAFFDVNYSPRDALPYDYYRGPEGKPSIGAKLVPGEKAWVYLYGRPTVFKNKKGDMDFSMNGFFDKQAVKSANDLYNDAMTELMYTKAVAPFAAFIRVPSTVRFFISSQSIVNSN